MLRHGRANSRGDTLIEVLFAVSVFSLIAVGGLAVMNQGSAAAQRSLEISLVRNQMNSQAETLRFLNSSYVSAFHAGAIYDSSTPAGQWALMSASIKAHPISNLSTLGGSSCPPSYVSGDFILNTQLATFVDNISQKVIQTATTYPQVTYITSNGQPVISSSQGIWIEGVSYDPATSGDSAQSTIGYIDFHIFACWDSPGQAVPVTLGTIVRLYEPR
jgi:prepilin-type N-terminal cleavage/methylation domain-containing protein